MISPKFTAEALSRACLKIKELEAAEPVTAHRPSLYEEEPRARRRWSFESETSLRSVSAVVTPRVAQSRRGVCRTEGVWTSACL